MKRTWIVLSVLALSGPVSWADSQALAQSDFVIVSPSKIEVARPPDVWTRIEALDRAYDEVSLRGPKTGVVISSLLLVGSVVVMGAGVGALLDPPPKMEAMLGTGAVVGAASLSGLIVSAIRLKKKRREKRNLRQQRIALEREL